MSLKLTSAAQDIGNSVVVRSQEDRRNRLVSKLAKADGAIVIAEDDVGADSARAIVAPETHVDAVASLLTLSVQAVRAAEARKAVIESALRGLDVEPNESDVRWARANVGRMSRIVRSIGRGEGRAQAIVKAIRLAKLADEPKSPNA